MQHDAMDEALIKLDPTLFFHYMETFFLESESISSVPLSAFGPLWFRSVVGYKTRVVLTGLKRTSSLSESQIMSLSEMHSDVSCA